MAEEEKQTVIMKANRLLQAKAGHGEVKAENIKKSQAVIDQAKLNVDFIPLANGYLDELESAIDAARKDRSDGEKSLQKIIEPIMQLKGNAAMFNYDLVGDLTTTMLNFLEAQKEINDDIIEIAEAHHKTIKRIVDDQISGKGQDMGAELQQELRNACRRYIDKYGL